MLTTADCHFNKETKTLVAELPNFPATLEIKSTHTGRVMKFTKVPYDHPFHDPDGWDGEGMAYIPTQPCNVEKLMVWHGM